MGKMDCSLLYRLIFLPTAYADYTVSGLIVDELVRDAYGTKISN